MDGKRSYYITYEERLKIEKLYKKGLKAKYIALALDRQPSTICREIKKGWRDGCYSAEIAQKKAIH